MTLLCPCCLSGTLRNKCLRQLPLRTNVNLETSERFFQMQPTWAWPFLFPGENWAALVGHFSHLLQFS